MAISFLTNCVLNYEPDASTKIIGWMDGWLADYRKMGEKGLNGRFNFEKNSIRLL